MSSALEGLLANPLWWLIAIVTALLLGAVGALVIYIMHGLNRPDPPIIQAMTMVRDAFEAFAGIAGTYPTHETDRSAHGSIWRSFLQERLPINDVTEEETAVIFGSPEGVLPEQRPGTVFVLWATCDRYIIGGCDPDGDLIDLQLKNEAPVKLLS